MITVNRCRDNPILSPMSAHPWEAKAAFNGCVIKSDDIYRMVYRALSSPQTIAGSELPLSTVGYTDGPDGIHFENRRQLITPEFEWERYGCEDPRVTKIADTYHIFYTALSAFPFSPNGIRIGVALTQDFHTIIAKHPVTPFNAKAMALFPEKIHGNYTAILTVDTDLPPAKICIASAKSLSDFWDATYWDRWHEELDTHTLPLLRSTRDHLEVGAPPIKTSEGWLIIYCYIRHYQSSARTFGIEAVLLDTENPMKIIGRTSTPVMVPQKSYELQGNVPNVIFPTGALLNADGHTLAVYYGATDTTCCRATVPLGELMTELTLHSDMPVKTGIYNVLKFERSRENPIISPVAAHPWESKTTLNPAAVYKQGAVHILYRAQGADDRSVLGYATATDGIHIDTRLPEPVYRPRNSFEAMGCEDPRLMFLENRLYMCYTAYDAKNPTRVALTSISEEDFLSRNWVWDRPILISPPGTDDKNACLFPEKINGRYVFLHRIAPCIWIDFMDSLRFGKGIWLKGTILMDPRTDWWDSEKIGIASPPIKTPDGWLLLYHGLSKIDRKYRIGAALLHKEHPDHVIGRLREPILEPQAKYETRGLRPGTVFGCGAVVINGIIFFYYGGADQCVAVATINLKHLVTALKS
ncbi:hypothetical protein M1555_03630 [Patescibacteria group bacterium]|nr:hypothetical protein [Patescibacteria group bacterium]